MKKRLLTLFITLILALGLATVAAAMDVNDPSVFLNEESSSTCTLVSTTMMLRRKAIVDADANWSSITIPAVRRVAWSRGLAWNFTYNGVHVTVAKKNSGWAGGSLESKRQALIDMLAAHPEGIVAYCSTQPHAVLLTDYDYDTGIFYCSDPAPSCTSNRMPLVNCVIKGATQDAVLEKINQLWYVDYGTSKGAGTASWEPILSLKLQEAQAAFQTAREATQEVVVDETLIRLQMYALLDEQGNDVNYVKLRELAQALSGTQAQFDVGYDGTVTLTTDSAYQAGEDSDETPFAGDQVYTVPDLLTTVNGAAVQLDAIQLTDEQGGGHTYYNLRDLGKVLGYQVEWDPTTGIRIRVDDEVEPEEIPSDHLLEVDM